MIKNRSQLKKAQAQANEKLEAARAIVAMFEANFSDGSLAEVDWADEGSNAWNAANDLVQALEGAADRLEADFRRDKLIAAGHGHTLQLIAENRD